jgi:hypothetical protein
MIELFAVPGGKSDSIASARNHPDDSALEMALEIDDQVEPARAHAPQERHKRPRRVPSIVNDQFVKPRMPFYNGFGLGLDRPGDICLRPGAPHAPEQRQRTHHITDRAQQDYQYAIRYRRYVI